MILITYKYITSHKFQDKIVYDLVYIPDLIKIIFAAVLGRCFYPQPAETLSH